MPSHEKARIGLVEDDPIMGESIAHRLDLEGYHVDWWQSGEDALRAVRAKAPDLLVCDIRLPDINGEVLFDKVIPDHPGLPVLFITGFAQVHLPPDSNLRSARNKVAYDRFYILRVGAWMDVYVYLCTALKLVGQRRRLLDYLNTSGAGFFAVWTHATTHYVNRAHVMYARPLE